MALHVVDALASVALSGTTNVTIPVPQGTQQLIIRTSCKYAAVAATSGITASYQVSLDGTTFAAAGEPNLLLKPAANVIGSDITVFNLGNSPFHLDSPSNINAVKVTLTNADATNPVTVAISHEAASSQSI
jgi:hypothetical protein